MGKKKNKNSISNKHKSIGEQSEQSCYKECDSGCNFKVSLVPHTDEPNNYYRWIKDCSWKNVVFIHPSVTLALRCNLLLIKGKRSTSIFIPYSLKTVRKASVVMLNDMGFEHEEIVFLYPFKGSGYEAENIHVQIQPEIELTDITKDIVRKKLCNRFMWPDLKLTFELFEIKYEITVSKVTSSTQIVLKNTSQNPFSKDDSSSFEFSQMSLCASSSNISMTKFDSFITFSPKLLDDWSDNELSGILPSQVESSAFFTLSYKTNIIFPDESINVNLIRSHLVKIISSTSDQILSVKKGIDYIFPSITQKASNHHVLLIDSLENEKNLVLKMIHSEYINVHIEEILLSNLCYRYDADLLDQMRQKFKVANEKAPCILILDKFEDLSVIKNKQSLITDTLCDLIATCDTRNLIIACVTNRSKYDDKIFSSCFVQEIKVSSCDLLDYEEIIQQALNEIDHNLTPDQVKKCAELCQGLKRKEVYKIVKYQAQILCRIRVRNVFKNEEKTIEKITNFCDVKTAIKEKKTTIVSPQLTSKKVTWADIGGMTQIKEKLKEEIELIQMCPENIKRFNYEPSKGILLYGPPGCSKTMIAQALANECNWNFISKKSSDILNMYVGESEKAVTKLFLDARARSPCIIFLDEIDALAPERTSCSNASGVQNRIVNALLTEIDGIETLKNIMIIVATNRPDIVDKAFLRSGRIGLHIYVPLPDKESRKEIFKLCLKRRNIASDVNLDILVEHTNGYTGAEIVHVCDRAALQVLFDDPSFKSTLFTMSHFERALSAVPPRTSKETIQFYEEFSSK